VRGMKLGARDYIGKPFSPDELRLVVRRALDEDELRRAHGELTKRLAYGSMIGDSPAMQQLRDTIDKVAKADATVLITGESGTGKELVARALHSEGVRAKAPFIAVNCGAIPEELMESELFGHKRGAFTGAIADKVGMFQEADGGTLFLDEIGELSLGLQVKLLRALQERRVKPVGATEELEVDVRMIAATNRDLESEVARGAFRPDLYYRLNVIELRLPPLRHRREDIPLLAEHFLRRFSAEHHRAAKLSAEAMRRLESYEFPGNVRELENIIERAVALSSSALIGASDLPETRTPRIAAPQPPSALPPDGVDLDQLVSDYERTWVLRALEQTGGVRKRAAALLGISFRSLRYRLEKLGIDRGDDKAEDDAE
jgi:two-component system, NtrC family, response regulator PilR